MKPYIDTRDTGGMFTGGSINRDWSFATAGRTGSWWALQSGTMTDAPLGCKDPCFDVATRDDGGIPSSFDPDWYGALPNIVSGDVQDDRIGLARDLDSWKYDKSSAHFHRPDVNDVDEVIK